VNSYEKLLTFQQCEEIYDLTVGFCKRFLRGREMLRQRDQMVQAARSAKQCIAEGATQGTSLKGYIKMIGVSRGSLEELLNDYRDFARLRNISVWDKSDPRLKKMGEMVKRVERETGRYELPSTPSQPSDPSYPLNYLVDLIIRTNYLLDKQKKSLEEKFIKEGGYSESLLRKRLDYRKKF